MISSTQSSQSSQTDTSARDRARLTALLRERARRSFPAFYEYVTGWACPPHIVDAAAHADAHPYAGELLPRGHAKTTGLTVLRTAWKIGRDPSYRNVTVSRGERLVRRISRRVKRVMRSEQYVELFGDIAPLAGTTKDTEAEWERRGSTADEPTFVGLGAGGPVPGTRADEVIVDDPIKLQDVQTRAQRDKLHEWFLTELLPVANDPDSRILLLGTRYHEDDLYGRLMQSEGDELELEDEDVLDAGSELWAFNVRKAVENGRPLWPELWSLQRLARRRARLGEAIYGLQYDNDTTGMGGHVFRREWFRYTATPPPFVQVRAGVDLAISEKQSADETAVVVVGETAAHELVVLDYWAERVTHGHRDWLLGVESDGTKLRIVDGQLVDLPYREGAPQLLRSSSPYRSVLSALNIEAVAWQSQFARELLAGTRLPVRPMQTKSVDKVGRARPLAVRYEQGKVLHVERLRGSKLESQLTSFPSSEHDDLIDALVYAADVGYAPQVFA